jgi:hypothetical protein
LQYLFFITLLRPSKPKFYTFSIPCAKHIKKFVASVYGLPFRADRNSSLGFFVNVCLAKEMYDHRLLPGRHPETMSGEITVVLNYWQYEKLGSDIAPDRVVAINNFIEELFAEQLYLYCQAHINTHSRYKGYEASIRSFAERHGIVLDADDEDISYETLKRKELRYRRAMEKKCKPAQCA